MDINLIWVALAAFAGTITSAVIGWLDSGLPFEPRKFTSSVMRGFAAAVGLAVIQYLNPPLTWGILIGAYLAGAGVDVLGNRIAGAAKTK